MATTERPDREWRRQYLELPDPLAQVPARFLSAQGFAERLLRLIVAQQDKQPETILTLIQEQCERLVWEKQDGDD